MKMMVTMVMTMIVSVVTVATCVGLRCSCASDERPLGFLTAKLWGAIGGTGPMRKLRQTDAEYEDPYSATEYFELLPRSLLNLMSNPDVAGSLINHIFIMQKAC